MIKNLRKSIAVIVVLLLISALALFGMGTHIADDGKGEVSFVAEKQTGVYKAPASATGIATLRYDPNDPTVVTGVEFDSDSALCEVTIPAAVTKINDSVFSCKTNIIAVNFENNSKLTTIGASAFAQTSIESIKLPGSVTAIGTSAFSGCSQLKSVTLPARGANIGFEAFKGCPLNNVTLGTNTKLGVNVFEPNVILIADSNATYTKLRNDSQNAAYKDRFTYVYTINYNYAGAVVETEQKLFGKDYKFELKDEVWAENAAITELGTAISKAVSTTWNTDESLMGEEASIDNIGDFVVNGKTTVYAGNGTQSDFEHVAETEFDPRTSYTVNDLGGIFFDLPMGGVEVELIAYINENDESITPLPAVAQKVGTYIYKTTDESAAYVLKIVNAGISFAVLNQPDWKIVDGSTRQNLLSEVVYLYEMSNGGRYPSVKKLETLTDEQQAMGININRFDSRRVAYSVVRAREGSVRIDLDTRGKYTATTVSGNERSGVGMYTAVAELTANEGYVFDTNSYPAANRGITVDIAADGKTATMTKVWFIVEINNWFVFERTNSEYDIENREYGDYQNVIETPRLMYGDVAEAQYGTDGDPVTLSLYLKTSSDDDYRLVGEFKRNEFGKYLTSAMPAGDYKLNISTGTVTDTDGTQYDPIGSEIVFEVSPKAIDLELIRNIDHILIGKPFNYEWDNVAHWYDATTASEINKLLNDFDANPDRTGTIWGNDRYEALYSELGIVFNLARMQSDTYYTAGNIPVNTAAPGAYKVYYKISAQNYLDSLQSRENSVRTDYYFSVTVIREISAPKLGDVTYNGKAQKADIGTSEFYTVKPYDGFTEAGTHSVTLVLREKDYYRWENKSLGVTELSVPFVINPAPNNWVESPDVVRWVEGNFDENENKFIGAVNFGTISYVITDTEENVIYDLSQGIDERASMKAGTYILRASVDPSDNYNGLSEAFVIRILEKEGMPWWGTLSITLGALIIAAIIILILWKKGVFQILTGKIVLAIRTRASVDATIAAVRAAKMMEEGRRSVEEAKRREAEEQAQNNSDTSSKE